MSATPHIDYACFDEMIGRLRAAGHAETAAHLDLLLHRTGWTTGSELLGELGLAILAFEKSHPRENAEVQDAIRRSMEMVRRVWPQIGSQIGG